MKYTLIRSTSYSIDYDNHYLIKEVELEGEALFNFLHGVLVEVMKGTLDTDIAGRTPEIYLKNLQIGRLGNFSKRYILAAEHNEKTIGILIGLPDSDNEKGFHIFSLGVSPEFRGQGIGKALMGKCIEGLKDREYTDIILDVHAENKPALQLYKKLGFHEFKNI